MKLQMPSIMVWTKGFLKLLTQKTLHTVWIQVVVQVVIMIYNI